jgi:hypothetical protein
MKEVYCSVEELSQKAQSCNFYNARIQILKPHWRVEHMKLLMKALVVPAALLATLTAATVAQADVQTPIPSGQAVSQGSSGGSQSSQCGFIASAPNEVVRVTGGNASLRFTLQSEGQPTLLIQGPGGRNQCVMADSYSGGNIEVPGVWEEGTYSVFVGDRTQASHPYTLTIVQEN